MTRVAHVSVVNAHAHAHAHPDARIYRGRAQFDGHIAPLIQTSPAPAPRVPPRRFKPVRAGAAILEHKADERERPTPIIGGRNTLREKASSEIAGYPGTGPCAVHDERDAASLTEDIVRCSVQRTRTYNCLSKGHTRTHARRVRGRPLRTPVQDYAAPVFSARAESPALTPPKQTVLRGATIDLVPYSPDHVLHSLSTSASASCSRRPACLSSDTNSEATTRCGGRIASETYSDAPDTMRGGSARVQRRLERGDESTGVDRYG
ncbi:hypothetical protein C8R44DRAFT_886821 [Mycena epipterygia]|nr:hypothetical protein C8R44DRAFT_886821 [Mycena epipterygia]